MTDNTHVPTAVQVQSVLCGSARELTWQGGMRKERYLHRAFPDRLHRTDDLQHVTGDISPDRRE